MINDNNIVSAGKDAVERLMQSIALEPISVYPHELIELIIQNQEQSAPELLHVVEKFIKDPVMNDENGKAFYVIVVLFLLAKMKDSRTFPHLVKLCAQPHHFTEQFFGDASTENLHSILASTFNDNFDALYTIVANQYLNEYIRWAALDAYIILYKYERLSHKQFIMTLNKLFTELCYDYSAMPIALINCCYEIGATECFDHIEHCYRMGKADSNIISFDNVKQQFSRPASDILHELKQNEYNYHYIDDLQECMGWMFRKMDTDDCVSTVRIGRNEPCPCGSGKKYKKCCSIRF
jgi:hypothetical protein